MKRTLPALLLALWLSPALLGEARAAEAKAKPKAAPEADAEPLDDDPFAKEETQEAVPPIADPIQPVNRAFYHFNDKLYFWVLKPVSRGYRAVLPQKARVGVRNFFSNITTPIRMTNCLLQADLEGTYTEFARFAVNTTVGVLGFGDPARHAYDIEQRREDFGQTLAVYGLGHGFYIHWPLFGPSSPRETVGLLGDIVLDPVTYTGAAAIGIAAFDRVNGTSLTLGDYEDFKAGALDPYIAIRDAYNQHRAHAVSVRRKKP